MLIQRCHFCSAPIYPGEKRCGVTIRIYPDREEDPFWEDAYCDHPGCEEGCLSGTCGWEENQGEDEFFQEAHIVLCKTCQDQFLENPSIKKSLLLLRKEGYHKTVH